MDNLPAHKTEGVQLVIEGGVFLALPAALPPRLHSDREETQSDHTGQGRAHRRSPLASLRRIYPPLPTTKCNYLKFAGSDAS